MPITAENALSILPLLEDWPQTGTRTRLLQDDNSQEEQRSGCKPSVGGNSLPTLVIPPRLVHRLVAFSSSSFCTSSFGAKMWTRTEAAAAMWSTSVRVWLPLGSWWSTSSSTSWRATQLQRPAPPAQGVRWPFMRCPSGKRLDMATWA